MGSPISGLFADLVMEDLETKCLRKLNFAPIFYFRYVDIVIACIPHDKLDEMLTIFNAYDDRLQFTYELENNNRISVINVLIVKNEENIETGWYTKPNFSVDF